MTQRRDANPLDYEKIRNTIARYCIALDTKDFTLFDKVFAKELYAKYPFGGAFTDRSALAEAITKRLSPVTTQHALTTQIITINQNNTSASATTYFTGVHLGEGRWKGQLVTAYGKYVDELIFVPFLAEWLINKREVIFMGRVGDEGVMKGEQD
ncbi:hypothetical protein BDV97DRAFT_305916 [Delphinella strobiligena]|nr:hypothetical protein BDV97DRAFT_305916 [Delphinella strobiligena]